MKVAPGTPGETFLLFHNLPYDFVETLPLPIGPNIYLDNTPQDVLNAADPPSLADYVYPGYNLPGFGLTNCCLRSSAAQVKPHETSPFDLFFLCVGSLRLYKPTVIEIAGAFKLGQEDMPIRDPALFLLTSTYQPEGTGPYTSKDIRICKEIIEQQIHVDRCGYNRLTTATQNFTQVTCGVSKSFEMSYLALFAALEALFVPKGNKAKTLASRIAKFLSHFDFSASHEDYEKFGGLKGWLENEYIHRRSNLTHGMQEALPWRNSLRDEGVTPRERTLRPEAEGVVLWGKTLRPEKAEAFGRLHEITRLCILGFLSFDDDTLAVLTNSNGPKLQKELDNLNSATGRLLDSQQAWCV